MGKIVAVFGMCGAGKSVATEYFLEKGYKRVYFGDITFDRMKKEGIEITPDNEKITREKIRKELGMGAYAILSLPKIKELAKDNDVIIESMYSWDELKIVQKEFGDQLITISVVVDKNLRYDRLTKRKVRPLNNVEAKNRDIAEIENSAKAGPVVYADYFVLNNGTVDDFYKRMDEILEASND